MRLPYPFYDGEFKLRQLERLEDKLESLARQLSWAKWDANDRWVQYIKQNARRNDERNTYVLDVTDEFLVALS